MAAFEMRGLQNFISDMRRLAQNREEERRRIENELAKIRGKFKANNKLSAYDRKKYVCKLLFISMLGHRIDFGHMEGVQLLTGKTLSEKIIGYLSVTVLLNENHELLTLTTHTVKLDLNSGDEVRQCLALTCIANVGGKDFAESAAADVQKLVVSKSTAAVRKKAYLTLLRLYRKYPEVVVVEDVAKAVVDSINSTHLGVSCSALSLALGLLSNSENTQYFERAPQMCIKVLNRVIHEKEAALEYMYHTVPAPWVQIKALRLMQYYECPTGDAQLSQTIRDVLVKILGATDRVIKEFQAKKQNAPPGAQSKGNAMMAVLVEALSLTLKWDNDAELITEAAAILGKFIAEKSIADKSNVKYLGLAHMARISFCQSVDFVSVAQTHMNTIVGALHDSDISIRRRALDLLYAMCEKSNAAEIVGELMDYLPMADTSIKEDLVLMIAILAEKFCGDFAWYVDVILNLVAGSGDYVKDDIWQRVCHIVTNTPDVQKHAAEVVFRAVASPYAHEVAVKIAAHVLGEYGYQIALNTDMSPLAQFSAMHSKFSHVTDHTKAMVLTCYAKFYNLFEGNQLVRDRVKKVFNQYRSYIDAEVQQRAAEYYILVTEVSDDTMQAVLESMPAFDVSKNAVLSRLVERQQGVDRNIWMEKTASRDQKHSAESAMSMQQQTTAAAGASPQSARHRDPQVDVMPVPEPEAPPPQRQDSLSMMFGGDLPTEAPPPKKSSPPPSPAPSPQRDVMDDLFGDASPSKPAAADPAPQSPMASAIDKYFKQILFAPQGLIFEGNGVQIGYQYEYKGADCRLMMVVGNDGAVALDNLSVEVAHCPDGLIVQNKDFQKHVDPHGKVVVAFAARSETAFEGKPRLNVGFSISGNRVSLPLPMPILAVKFFEPYTVETPERFFQVWSATPASPTPVPPRTLTLPRSMDVTEVEAFLYRKMKMYSVRPEATKVCAVAAHSSQPITAQSPTFTPVMAIVEGEFEEASARVTVHCPSAVLLKLTMDMICEHIGK